MVERLFLVRHGETVGNTLDLMQGFTDSDLTDTGIEQAKALGEVIAEKEIDVIYCSDLGRTRQTLRESGLEKKFKVIYTDQLRERNYGIAEDMPWNQLPENQVLIFKSHNLRFDKGESMEDLSARVIPFVNKMFLEKEHTAMILSHHNTLTAIMCFLTGMPLEKWRTFKIDNASFSEFYYNDYLWRIKSLNEIWHLKHLQLTSFE